MVHKWKPSKSDIEWTSDLIKSLKIGGTWGTSFATFKKVSENEFAIEKINPDPRENAFENIDKVKKVFSILGVKLEGKYDYIMASLIPKKEFFIGIKKKRSSD